MSELELLNCLLLENLNEIAALEKRKKNKRRHRKMWVRKYYERGKANVNYIEIISTMNIEGPEFYRQFTRITEAGFKFILDKIRHRIQKKDTYFRSAITAEERLSVTLKYLAAGDIYFTLCSLFRMSRSSISKMIPEVCEAICEELKTDFLKVRRAVFIIINIHVLHWGILDINSSCEIWLKHWKCEIFKRLC